MARWLLILASCASPGSPDSGPAAEPGLAPIDTRPVGPAELPTPAIGPPTTVVAVWDPATERLLYDGDSYGPAAPGACPSLLP